MQINKNQSVKEHDIVAKSNLVRELNVSLQWCEQKPAIPVGHLAYQDKTIYFEYETTWLEQAIELSPFALPPIARLQKGDQQLFQGLPGVFEDSLPDGWGRLLIDRHLRQMGVNVHQLSPLDRLAYVGQHAMGALIYQPTNTLTSNLDTPLNLDTLYQDSQHILNGDSHIIIDELLTLNGASAGARPKALIGFNQDKSEILSGISQLPQTHDYWIVKFSNQQDDHNAGAIEYAYSNMARAAGIEITETHLFPAKDHAGYFATKRFDREQKNEQTHRYHIHTACGLLHADFRVPSLDYSDLLTLCWRLTKDTTEVLKLYRLAVFNVFTHNRDDHGKNFSFLMTNTGQWRFAPAYDLTFSSGPHGEHSTMVMNEGKSPTIEHLKALAQSVLIDAKQANMVIEQVLDAVNQWTRFACDAGLDHRYDSLLPLKHYKAY